VTATVYRLSFRSTLAPSTGLAHPELIAPEFMEAVKTGREPAPGWSVLLAMRVLHQVQPWDARHGKQVLSGRPVT
jgi:hypothetical protein